jgi:hypothetical protein
MWADAFEIIEPKVDVKIIDEEMENTRFNE